MGSYAHKLMVRGVGLHQQGKLGEAEGVYREVLAIEPRHGDALHLLGVVLHQRGRSGEGVELVKKAIQVRPGTAEYWVNAGEILRAMGRLEEALHYFEGAARLNPNIPELHNNVATLHGEMNHLGLAENALKRALGLRPGFAEAWVNWGNLEDRRGRWGEAIEAYKKALAIDPNNAAGLASMGNVLGKMGRTEEALGVLVRAVQINPGVSKARNNLGNILQSRGLLAESLNEYRAAIGLDPRNVVAYSNLLFALNRDPSVSPGEVFEAHRGFGERFEGQKPEDKSRKSEGEKKVLRVGFVSPDMRKHSVAYFLEPILRHYDRGKMHVTCYSNTVLVDGVTERLKGLVDGWRDVGGMNDSEMEGQVRADGIDVLVDLAGHTEGNRLLVFARRVAPVQVTYLGYPNTTGLRSIRYRITDGVADPVGVTDRYHTEKLARLPRSAWCYLPPEDAPDPRMAMRGLSGGGVTFGSFNNLAKVSPGLMGLWSLLLRRVEGSRMVLKSRALGDGGTREFVWGVFEKNGVGRERVELMAWEPSAGSHLGMYGKVDIALDTYPYHGTTTTCEALYMGVPVVTLEGRTHVSRVGVSLLNSVGLSELVAKNEEEYVGIAARLAGDLEGLGELRQTLRGRLLASPLCDGVGFAREFEQALLGMWKEYVCD